MQAGPARLLLASAAALVVLASCSDAPEAPRPEDGVTVVASFYPLQFVVGAVGRAEVEVQNLTAAGVEPHDLELSADQVGALSEADLVVFLGGGFQPALEDVVSGLDPSALFDVLDEDTARIADDPHIWLDPTIMATVAERTASRLAQVDPGNEELYRERAGLLRSRLDDLDRSFERGLADCRSRAIVTSHDAFGYLAARYDLDQVSIAGIDPEAEPSPGRLAEVARFVEENDVTTIFFEELVSPDVAETIASETGAETAMLNPLESQPASGDYIDAMQDNLAALTEALGCG